MTEKERQHYVPKFHLRRFSHNGNLKQIGLYNSENKVFVQTAKLKTQAYNPFFYGKDGVIEDLLSDYEGYHANLLEKIISKNYIPQRNSVDHVELLRFLLLTQLRNPVSTEYMNKSFDNFSEIMSKKSVEYKDVMSDKLTPEQSVAMSLSGMKTSLDLVGDLHYKLIINETEIPFITSDNPLTKYNQFLEWKKHDRGTTGFGNIGLQMFFAISPNKMIAVYDSWCYKYGSAKKSICITESKTDIEQLNILHFLNCNTTVYFNHQINRPTIENLFQRSSHFQKANVVVTKEFDFYEKGTKKENSSIIMNMTTDAKIKIDLTFVKFLDNAKFASVDNSMAQIRPIGHAILDERRRNGG